MPLLVFTVKETATTGPAKTIWSLPYLTNWVFNACAFGCSPHTSAVNSSNRFRSHGCALPSSDGNCGITRTLTPQTSCIHFSSGAGGPVGDVFWTPKARAGDNLVILTRSPPLCADDELVTSANTSFSRSLPSPLFTRALSMPSIQLPIRSGARGGTLKSWRPWLEIRQRRDKGEKRARSFAIGQLSLKGNLIGGKTLVDV